MRKFTLVLMSLVVALSLMLSACGTSATPTPKLSADDLVSTLTAMPTNTLAPSSTLVPTSTLLPPTNTPIPSPTSVRDTGMQLNTAADIRVLFSKVNGWVSGGEGQWVAGAQGTLRNDLILKDLPEWATFEFDCVQYHTLAGVIVIKKVCPSATVSYSEVIPANSFGTMWLNWSVVLKGDKLPEGFLNKPCVCPSGDCRKP